MQTPIPYEIAALLMGGTMCAFMALYFSMDSKGTKSPKRFLAGFLFIYGLTFIDNFWETSDLIFQYPRLAGLMVPSFFLLGPFLYFYIRDMCDPESYKLDRKRYRHFIMPVIAVVLMMTFYSFPDTLKFSLLMEEEDLPETGYFLIGVLGVVLTQIMLPVQILYYLVKSYRIIRRHFTTLKQFFANVEDHKLDWLRVLIIMLSIQWLLYAFDQLFGWSDALSEPIGTITTLVDVGIIYFLSFKGLRHDAVLREEESLQRQLDTIADQQHPKTEPETETTRETPQPAKYAKSALSDADSERILHKLQQALELDQLYKDNMLSLRSLSDHTRISPNYISQVINQNLNCNFFDFINKFRVRAAQEKLVPKGDEKISVLDVAHEVGFNSKSTFNTAFKRYTGLTPTQYRKQQQSSA
ncbi:helix-turn-helix domain-containing protein [Paremcibacter congregatus]|uniref:HTH araC/xylS-type domain-containing protein n=1 Tax=Paremcibacter congregatus TaxID=2043170 RepID=A0A2G4YP53_9PROT|nr:helix-turn-helix domain-containing protein [Paremcibacter congregatus]PHZ83246.1 hypothetical protein CRD36_16865 [Paremcibacter congregatus]QDE28282.1 AraC family transcriptional regulator [Paremcibacter congregatus]